METEQKPLFIARTDVDKLFRGLNKKTLANLLSEGRGPRAYKNGRKVFYKVADIEAWLTQRPILTADQEASK